MGSAEFGLPLSMSSTGRKQRVFSSSTASSGVFGLGVGSLSPERLRARARLTNLAALLLIGGLIISALLNVTLFFGSGSQSGRISDDTPWYNRPGQMSLAAGNGGVPQSIAVTIHRDERVKAISHLVMVPGHAIWHGHESASVLDESEWVLDAIQKGGSIKTYVKHIEEGVRVAGEDPQSLLVFSGGQTRPPPAPLLSEAQSYLAIAQTLSLLPPVTSPLPAVGPLPLPARVTTEEFALDSYQNLLFALARFKEFTGAYPQKITVIGYGMKRNRFVDLHRATLRFKPENFTYIGFDDEGDTSESYAGELKFGYTPFLTSPSGCHPPLSIKRFTRNPYYRHHPYHVSCPELHDLFEWCPPLGEGVFDGYVPWDTSRQLDSQEARWGREQD